LPIPKTIRNGAQAVRNLLGRSASFSRSIYRYV
jgi:hypothetical protein